jgi:hypothetical protein
VDEDEQQLFSHIEKEEENLVMIKKNFSIYFPIIDSPFILFEHFHQFSFQNLFFHIFQSSFQSIFIEFL